MIRRLINRYRIKSLRQARAEAQEALFAVAARGDTRGINAAHKRLTEATHALMKAGG